VRFTDDTMEALRSAVHLANSAEDPDTLASRADFDAFLQEFPYTGRIDRSDAELAALRALRPRLRGMLLAPRDEMVEAVNEALHDIVFAPHVVRHDDADWHLHAVADDRPLPERVLAETAMALLDVVRAGEGSRLTVCADDACTGVVLDLSRNRSRRYCSTACTNRNAVAAYRARQQ
jgi:predicted RNA-binding Zn ribbon-like protein